MNLEEGVNILKKNIASEPVQYYKYLYEYAWVLREQGENKDNVERAGGTGWQAGRLGS